MDGNWIDSMVNQAVLAYHIPDPYFREIDVPDGGRLVTRDELAYFACVMADKMMDRIDPPKDD